MSQTNSEMWKNLWSYLVVVILVAAGSSFLTVRCGRDEVADSTETVIRDTVTVRIIDTLEVVRPLYISETIIDTIYVLDTAKNALKLPITQKYYKGEYYEAWVSGYKPNLDTIRTYAPTEYKYITVETVKETFVRQKWGLYAGIDGIFLQNSIAPFVSAQLVTPSRLSFSLGVGVMNKDVAYKFGIGYKMF